MTESQRRPNIVVVLVDQQRWDTLGALGCPVGLTPNLDQMAERGTLYTTACAPNPVCAPARAALQTGVYPTSTGVWRNSKFLDQRHRLVGSYLAEAGYRTAQIGKWHLARGNPVPAAEREGYDHWLGSNILEFTSDAYRTVVYDNDDRPVRLPGYRSDALTDAAIRFITDSVADEQPFFCFLNHVEPHQQNELDEFTAPDVYRDAYHGAWLPPDLQQLSGSQHRHISGYYGQIRRLDEGLGRLRDALVSLDVADDTVLIYLSDHGSHFKTRNAEYKRSAHDASIRVPLVLDGPGYRGGGRVTRPVSTIDLVPTVLDAAGIELPDHLDGRPLRERNGAVAGGEDEDDPAVMVQISETEVGRALRTSRWKYHVRAEGLDDGPAAERYAEVELYDLHVDPYELDNLVDFPNYEEVTAALRERLIAAIHRVEGADVTIAAHDPQQHKRRFPQTTVRQLGLTGRLGEWSDQSGGE